jgi:PIN domain nuclease of toxin-antitoxin system
MDVILDTCGLLSLSGFTHKQLSKPTQQILVNSDYVFISACSLFELAVKHKKRLLNFGKFKDAQQFWKSAIERYDLKVLSVSDLVFYASTTLPDFHRDPFDRIIIAHALELNVSVITFDHIFQQYNTAVLN